MKSKAAILLSFFTVLSCSSAAEVETTAPFVAQVYVPQITRPRALLLDSAGDLLVTSATANTIIAIRETNHGNGSSTVETRTIVQAPGLGLTHGIAFHNGFLYASSARSVYRWPYKHGQFSLIDQRNRQIVIENIPPSGHTTRTLIFDGTGRLYISIGSLANIDEDSYRSRIRRFNLQQQFLPIHFDNGEIFADGCRNTVGLGFNSNGILFGVDNGADQLNRPDLGGAIWPGNPAEEMNKFNLSTGAHYGYPYCWSTYNLTNYQPNVQFAWPNFLIDGVYGDEWCRNPNNNAVPVQSMPAHAAPLSIQFYDGVNCGVNGGFPCDAIDDAFVAFRGSWHQGVANGYKVSWYPFNREIEEPTGEVIDILFSPNPTNSCNSCLRPANAIFNRDGHLIVTADTTNEIFRVAYNTTLPTITNVYR